MWMYLAIPKKAVVWSRPVNSLSALHLYLRRLAKTLRLVPLALAFPDLVHNQRVECLDRDQNEQLCIREIGYAGIYEITCIALSNICGKRQINLEHVNKVHECPTYDEEHICIAGKLEW